MDAAKMDLAKLRNHVFEQTGMRIDTTDPVFALVALNDAVLAEGVERQRAIIDELAERLAGQADELLEAGERFKRQVQRSGGKAEGGKSEGASGFPARRSLLQLAGLGAAVALLTASLTVAGMVLLVPARPASLAGAAPSPAPALTAEQILHMQNGERFIKVLGMLDAKTQAQIIELMRNP